MARGIGPSQTRIIVCTMSNNVLRSADCGTVAGKRRYFLAGASNVEVPFVVTAQDVETHPHSGSQV